jgi:hypothetical protein
MHCTEVPTSQKKWDTKIKHDGCIKGKVNHTKPKEWDAYWIR